MAETVRCVLFITLTIAFFGSADKEADLVPAAITVYRNPEFFRNMAERKEDLEKEGAEDEDKEDSYSNSNEEFYDFDDEYRYPGEPKKPNPPAPPDFFTYFDESPEFQSEPREISPSRGGIQEEEAEDENELNEEDRYEQIHTTTPTYYQYENQKSPEEERESSDEDNEDRESTEIINGMDDGYSEKQGDERSEEIENDREAIEEDYLESTEHSPENTKDERKKINKYHVPMEKDLQMKVPAKVYEESKEYFNPVLNSGIAAFPYPSSYEDLDYYSYEDEGRRKSYVDNKKGTREYLKDHSIEEVEDPRNPGNVRAGSKHIIRTVSKIGIHAFKPVLFVPHIPHVHRIKKKYKILHKPKKFYKWRHHRELPDDSVYQLSSDYDSEFEFF